MAHSTAGGFTDVELAAIKERAAELRAEKGGKKAAAALEDLLKSIRAMPEDQRVIAERIHVIVSEVAPDLRPKTWYGQPAWTNAEGKWCSSTPPTSLPGVETVTVTRTSVRSTAST